MTIEEFRRGRDIMDAKADPARKKEAREIAKAFIKNNKKLIALLD